MSDRKTDEQIAGARVEVDPEKKNPEDFALWIKAPKKHLMKWESPWGLSYPGWHIECSAMSRKYLGEEFDIHTGGIDHIPTHHENEIAQSKGRCGKIPAKFWMHCNFLTVDGGKMSKSLGNIYTIETLKEKGIDPIAYKLFCYSSHYRNNLNFTFEGVEAANVSLMRLREGFRKHLECNEEGNIDQNIIDELEEKFHSNINDDLNMTGAMSVLWEAVRYKVKSKQIAELLLKFDEVLGLKIDEKQEKLEIPEEIQELLEERKKAREEKNWKLSDEIRDIIQQKGYIIKDTKEGMTVEKS